MPRVGPLSWGRAPVPGLPEQPKLGGSLADKFEEQRIVDAALKLLRYSSIASGVAMLMGAAMLLVVTTAGCRQALLAADCWVWAAAAVGAFGYFSLHPAKAAQEPRARHEERPPSELGAYRPLRTRSMQGLNAVSAAYECLETCTGQEPARTASITQEEMQTPDAADSPRCAGTPETPCALHATSGLFSSEEASPTPQDDLRQPLHLAVQMPIWREEAVRRLPRTGREFTVQPRRPERRPSWQEPSPRVHRSQQRPLPCACASPAPRSRSFPSYSSPTQSREMEDTGNVGSRPATDATAAVADPVEHQAWNEDSGHTVRRDRGDVPSSSSCTRAFSASSPPPCQQREQDACSESVAGWDEFDEDVPGPVRVPAVRPVGQEMQVCTMTPEASSAKQGVRDFSAERTEALLGAQAQDARFLCIERTEGTSTRSEFEDEDSRQTSFSSSKLHFLGAYAALAFFVIAFCGVVVFEIITNLRPLPDRMPLTVTPRHSSQLQWPETPQLSNDSGKLLPYWQTGPWGHCSTGCGEGTKQRIVRCMFGSEAECRGSHGEEPPTSRSCREYSGCQWKARSWGECNATCGRGVQQRQVLCTNSQIADCFRELWTVPLDTKECVRVDSCRWETHPWGECSTTCGAGERRRNVTCMNGDILFCQERGQRPHQAEVCQGHGKCSWNASRWSPCSSRCGHGTRTRTVECPSKNASDCLDQDGSRPAREEQCHDVSGCRWDAGAWSSCSVRCGVGAQTRNMSCAEGSLEEDCLARTPQPKSEQSCRATEGCEWLGDWSGCTSACGTGERTRSVSCVPAHGPVPEGCGQAPGAVSIALTEPCVNTGGCRWDVGQWGTCSNGCGVGKQQRSVACSNGQSEDCAKHEAVPDRVRACNGTSSCPAASAASSPSACSCAARDPALNAAGVLSALVGWMVGFAGFHELLHRGVFAGSCRVAPVAPAAILLTGTVALIVGRLLGKSLLPGSCGAHEAALAGSQFATGFLGLGTWAASLWRLGAPAGMWGALAALTCSSRWQVVWFASSLALFVFCCVVLTMATQHALSEGSVAYA